jgi:hypothetical protein
MKNYSLLIMGGSNGDEDVDDEHAGGGWSPPEAIPAAFPPSDLLRRQPSVSCFVVLCFSAASFRETPGDLFYRRF